LSYIKKTGFFPTFAASFQVLAGLGVWKISDTCVILPDSVQKQRIVIPCMPDSPWQGFDLNQTTAESHGQKKHTPKRPPVSWSS